MSEAARNEISDTTVDRSFDVGEMLHALRSDGADRLDPVGFHYIEALHRRASSHPECVRRILEGKLVEAVRACKQRLAHKQGELPAAGCAVEHRAGLADLVRSLAQHASDSADGRSGEQSGAHAELKSVQHFRNTWSKLSADQLVKQALNQTPKNAGPINSHVVVLRSFALMRDTSPDYLNRFMSYVDTLLSLDHGGKAKPHRGRPR